MSFWDNKIALLTPANSRPDYLGTGNFTVKIKEMISIPLTKIKKVDGAAINVTILKSDNPKYKVGQVCSLTFLNDKSFGFARLKVFFKEVVGSTDEQLEKPEFYAEHFPDDHTKAPLVGAVIDVIGSDRETVDSKKETDPLKKKYYTSFRFSEGRFEE